MKIAMIGAGNIASTLARGWLRAGHDVLLSNRRGPGSLEALAQSLGARAGTPEEAVDFAEHLVVSVPLRAFPELARLSVAGKLVIDTCNYYPGRDGADPRFEDGGMTTSAALQQVLHDARIVKAFNSIMVADLLAGGGPVAGAEPHALPIASDDPRDAEEVAPLVRQLGLDPVYVGALAESWRFERARPVYCRPLGAAALRTGLERTGREDFVAENSWKRPAAD